MGVGVTELSQIVKPEGQYHGEKDLPYQLRMVETSVSGKPSWVMKL